MKVGDVDERTYFLRCMRKGAEDALIDLFNDEDLPPTGFNMTGPFGDLARAAYKEGHDLGRAIRAEIDTRIHNAIVHALSRGLVDT